MHFKRECGPRSESFFVWLCGGSSALSAELTFAEALSMLVGL